MQYLLLLQDDGSRTTEENLVSQSDNRRVGEVQDRNCQMLEIVLYLKIVEKGTVIIWVTVINKNLVPEGYLLMDEKYHLVSV